MITLHLLKQAVQILSQSDGGSETMLQRELGVDVDTASEIVDRLIDLNLISQDSIVRTFDIDNKTQRRLVAFLTKEQIEDLDELFIQAATLVASHKKASASMIQRYLSVGYARAARLMDQLESKGFISSKQGAGSSAVNVEAIENYLREN